MGGEEIRGIRPSGRDREKRQIRGKGGRVYSGGKVDRYRGGIRASCAQAKGTRRKGERLGGIRV